MKKLAPALSQQMRTKTKCNPGLLRRIFFPALDDGYKRLLQILIGSLRCLRLLWLARVIALVLDLRKSIENRTWVTVDCVSWTDAQFHRVTVLLISSSPRWPKIWPPETYRTPKFSSTTAFELYDCTFFWIHHAVQSYIDPWKWQQKECRYWTSFYHPQCLYSSRGRYQNDLPTESF